VIPEKIYNAIRALLAFVLAMAAVLIIMQARAAYSHEWFNQIRNPETGEGCCGGDDCVELRWDQFRFEGDEVVINTPVGFFKAKGEYQKNYGSVYRLPMSQALPARGPTQHPDDDNYSGHFACFWGGKLKCFFYPTSS
jgi:hypothetical protein